MGSGPSGEPAGSAERYVDRYRTGASLPENDENDVSAKQPRVKASVFSSSMLCISAICVGTYFWVNLLGAFEADPGFGWTKDTSALALTVAVVAEGAGLIAAGPLAQVVSPMRLLDLNVMVLCVAIAMLAFIQIVFPSKAVMIAFVAVASAAKGVMWPSIGEVITRSFHTKHFDLKLSSKGPKCALHLATGSHAAEVLGTLLLVMLLETARLRWRGILVVVALVVIVLSMCLRCVLFASQRQMMSAVPVLDEKSPAEKTAAELWTGLLTDHDSMLLLIALTGAYSVFVLFLYMPLIVQDMCGLSVGAAALSKASAALGLAGGLLIGGRVAWYSNESVMAPLQILVGSLALGVLANIHVDVNTTMVLLAVAGFGAALPLHLPGYVYGNQFFPASKQAWHKSVLNGSAMCLNAGICFGFGHLRMDTKHGSPPPLIFGIASGGLLLSSVATFFVMRSRLSNENFAHQLAEREEERFEAEREGIEAERAREAQRWKQNKYKRKAMEAEQVQK